MSVCDHVNTHIRVLPPAPHLPIGRSRSPALALLPAVACSCFAGARRPLTAAASAAAGGGRFAAGTATAATAAATAAGAGGRLAVLKVFWLQGPHMFRQLGVSALDSQDVGGVEGGSEGRVVGDGDNGPLEVLQGTCQHLQPRQQHKQQGCGLPFCSCQVFWCSREPEVWRVCLCETILSTRFAHQPKTAHHVLCIPVCYVQDLPFHAVPLVPKPKAYL